MNDVRQIAFGYSTQCNIKCDHCVASDDLPENKKMEFNTAKAIIEEMAYYNVTGISFTAGEPLIFFDDIGNLVEICKNKGIYSRIVTNGFWAKNREKSDTILSTLKLKGVSQLRISFSRWHQEHVPRENILNAVSSCRKYGVDYFVSFITDFSPNDDSFEQFLQDNDIKYFPEPLIYFGRAGKFTHSKILTDYQPNICTMNPYFSPECDMFACCDAGIHFSETNVFYLGNLKDNNIDELFKKKENNGLYSLVKTMGLTNIASYLGFKASDIVKFRKCELCEKLFNSPENLDRLEKTISDLIYWKR